MKKRLSELNPELGKNHLWFTCPACEKPHPLRVEFVSDGNPVPSTKEHPVWYCTSEVSIEKITLRPSLNFVGSSDCAFHGWIMNGEVRW